jgi:hypothetical protein
VDPAMKCRLTSAAAQARDNHHAADAVSGFRAFGFGTRDSHSARTAFSLLEVMIASGIFFMSIFAILAMVSSILHNARGLRRIELDAGMVAAQVCNTNILTEGADSGDFGKAYPGYSWESDTYEAETNGLWQVDIVVRRQGIPRPVDQLSILLYRPDSKSGFGRPNFRP